MILFWHLEHDPDQLPFSFQKHKSHFDLKWQCEQFTRFEKTTPMAAKVTNELKRKEGADKSETADLRELLLTKERQIKRQLRELDESDNPADQDEKCTRSAFL